jgi:hypothetical protein
MQQLFKGLLLVVYKQLNIHFIKNQLMHLLQKTLFYIHIKNTKNCVPDCVLSGRAKHDQTTHRQVHRTRTQIEGIRP